jgi:hypothetical protein
MLVDSSGNKGFVTEADQVRFGSGLPVHGGRETELAVFLLDQKGSDFKAFE